MDLRSDPGARVNPEQALSRRLTARERQVLLCTANGMTVHAIAAVLFISHHTVKGHLKSVREKLGARNSAHAVAIAWRQCLIEADEIDAGPLDSFRWMSEDQIRGALLSYRQRTKHLPPPVESWKDLRARAALLASAHRMGYQTGVSFAA